MDSENFDLSESDIDNITNASNQIDLEKKIANLKFQKIYFGIFICIIILLFGLSFWFAYDFIFTYEQTYAQNFAKFCNDNNISINYQNSIKTYSNVPESVLIGTMLMIPTILALAMMRFVFGSKDEQKDKNIPSIMFNIGVELKEVLLALIKKR